MMDSMASLAVIALGFCSAGVLIRELRRRRYVEVHADNLVIHSFGMDVGIVQSTRDPTDTQPGVAFVVTVGPRGRADLGVKLSVSLPLTELHDMVEHADSELLAQRVGVGLAAEDRP